MISVLTLGILCIKFTANRDKRHKKYYLHDVYLIKGIIFSVVRDRWYFISLNIAQAG